MMGVEESIIDAFMLGASLSPKKRKEMQNVIPTIPAVMSFPISVFAIFNLWNVKGSNAIAPNENLKKTNVKGGTSVRVHL